MSEDLRRLFAEDWDWEIHNNPEFASQAGCFDITPIEGVYLQGVSPESYDERAEHSKRMLAAVERIKSTGSLSKSDLIFASLFEGMHRDIFTAIEACPMFLIPINSIGCGGVVFSFSESIEWMRFESVSDFELYRKRLEAFPKQIDEYIASMRKGVSIGYISSAAVARDIEKHLESAIAGDLPEFTAPLLNEGVEVLKDSPELKQALEDGIANVKNCFSRFLEFFRAEYVPHLRSDPSCSSLPNGELAYSICLRFHTTTNYSAEEIHQIGLAEVARIEQRYRNEVLIPLGFDPSDFAGFVEFVRNDPQFYVQTTDALMDIYRTTCANIQDLMPSYFNEIPRSPLEITTRQGGPAAYYLAGTADGKRPGRFYVNVSHLEKRPVYETMALSLHEAIPGHHHQCSLSLENTELPNFLRFIEDRRYEVCPCRRNIFCGFSEGWALYCEHLGEEMGLYTTPYLLFGRFSMEMMRAVRLVVDTGLHAKGWTIEQCITYMMEKTGMHRHEVEVEIYRYANWPGQACAYKIGQMKIMELRARAEQELGAAFKLKDFHSLCLNSAPLTLTFLEEMVDNYIAEVKSNA